MIEILLQTLPFFAVIGLGFGAGKTGFFSEAATAALTKFVFFFALSAMLFRFSANLSFAEVYDPDFILAYLSATAALYAVVFAVTLVRGRGAAEAAVEAQCGVIGNTGFLGVPMMAILLGPQSIGPMMTVLAVDLIVFSSLIVAVITVSRDGRLSPAILGTLAMGLLKNPMIVAIVLGLAVSAAAVPIPAVVNDFVTLLGAAATPGALFAIGASLASKSAERMSVALWLSFSKLVLHPAAVFVAAFLVFEVNPSTAAIMVSAAALPVAGNIYMLAAHYGVAPQRVSASILLSTALSILTVPAVIAWVTGAG